ncbi:MAG TPA: RNA polymerase sigma-70 factor [Flavitalea sp.]|nr:RNA polymerase sigma-70 factor [Flavitalea sp.]
MVKFLTEGNEAAFEALYHLYSRRLALFLIKLLKSEDLACEVLQDVFVKVWNNRKNIDPAQSFRSYLFRIAENCVHDFFRKAARDKKLQEALIRNTCKDYNPVEDTVYMKERNRLLREAIEALPPKRRQIFQSVKIEGRSYEEVSHMLHVSVSTINDHIVKATKSIREDLERYHITVVGILFLYLVS